MGAIDDGGLPGGYCVLPFQSQSWIEPLAVGDRNAILLTPKFASHIDQRMRKFGIAPEHQLRNRYALYEGLLKKEAVVHADGYRTNPNAKVSNPCVPKPLVEGGGYVFNS